jgi:hypothetical protein
MKPLWPSPALWAGGVIRYAGTGALAVLRGLWLIALKIDII